MMAPDGGPAFPNKGNDVYDERKAHTYDGMSLRDWFAGQVIAAMLLDNRNGLSTSLLAQEAYRQADVMLAERDKAK